MNTTKEQKETNVIENHLFQMDVIRKSFKRDEEEIARVEDERNQDYAWDALHGLI